MTSYPEPTDVGPAAGGHLRVSDADRQHVQLLLSAAHSEGRITPVEFAERTEVASRAQIFDNLVPLTRDLVGMRTAPTLSSTPYPASTRPSRINPAGAVEQAEKHVSIFSSYTDAGLLRVRRSTILVNTLGSSEIDLTNATFDDAHVIYTNANIMGSTTIFVPEGVNAINEAQCFMSSVNIKGLRPDPAGPTIHLQGHCLMSSVEVYGPDSRRYQRRHRV